MIKINTDIFPIVEDGYIVGGAVRDTLLNRTPADYDVVVAGSPEDLANRIAAKIHGRIVVIGKSDRQILRVASKRYVVDVSRLSGPTIESDLAQRDFSIDAMALHLASGRIVDPFNGQADLDLKQIRMVSGKIFDNDPIRLLRAFRIAALLGFKIESGTLTIIEKKAALIRHTAGERIRTELFSLFEAPQSYPYLVQMSECGLLFTVFPEMTALKGCQQNQYHIYDVLAHTLETYQHLERLIFVSSEIAAPSTAQTNGLTSIIAGLLKCAALMHDIGKPAMRSVADGRVCFFGHACKSAEMAAAVAKRLKFSRHQQKFIDFIVRNHLRPLALFIAHRNQTLTPKGLTRFFLTCGDNTPFLLLHALADYQAKKNHSGKSDFNGFIENLQQRYFDEFKPLRLLSPLITGKDLIREFHLDPSPQFKTILDRVEEAHLSKTIKSRAEALKLAADILSGNQAG